MVVGARLPQVVEYFAVADGMSRPGGIVARGPLPGGCCGGAGASVAPRARPRGERGGAAVAEVSMDLRPSVPSPFGPFPFPFPFRVPSRSVPFPSPSRPVPVPVFRSRLRLVPSRSFRLLSVSGSSPFPSPSPFPFRLRFRSFPVPFRSRFPFAPLRPRSRLLPFSRRPRSRVTLPRLGAPDRRQCITNHRFFVYPLLAASLPGRPRLFSTRSPGCSCSRVARHRPPASPAAAQRRAPRE